MRKLIAALCGVSATVMSVYAQTQVPVFELGEKTRETATWMGSCYNAMRDAYILRNSWGIDWGRRGNCMIRAADMSRLLKEDGEACIPVVRVEKPAMS